jgi:dynein heavy chain 1
MLSTSHQLSTSGEKPTDDSMGDESAMESSTMGAPYEGLHSLVHFGVTPWFDAYISSKKVGVSMDGVGGKKAGEAQMGKFLPLVCGP